MPLCDCDLNDYLPRMENRVEEFEKFKDFILNAVENLHNHEIIHRDLKPANILIKDGRYFLADFGIAHYSSNAAIYNLTEKGERLANYRFSPKEQFVEHEAAHPTMDIYAIGQLFLWFVSGTTCTGAPTFSIPKQYPFYLQDLILKCIKDDPNARFQSIAEIRSFIKEKNEQVSFYDKNESHESIFQNFKLMLLSINSELDKNDIFRVNNIDTAIKEILQCFSKYKQDIQFVRYYYYRDLWDKDQRISQPHIENIQTLDYISGKIKINDFLLSIDDMLIYRDDSLLKSFIFMKTSRDYTNPEGYAIVDGKYRISLKEADNLFAKNVGEETNVDLHHRSIERFCYESYESYWILGVNKGIVTLSENLNINTKKMVLDYVSGYGGIEEMQGTINNDDWACGNVEDKRI